MIVNGDFHVTTGVDQVAGQADIGLAGRGIAAGMVVDDDERGRPKLDGAGDDFADMDGRFIDAARPHRLVRDQHVARVEEKDAHLFDRAVRHGRLKIIAQRLPTRQDRAVFNACFEQAHGAGFRDLERPDDAIGQAFATERIGIGGEQRADAAETGDEGLRLILGVASRNGEREEILDQFVVEQGLPAALEQALAQSATVTGG
jgi:hypothetical protein